MPRTIQKQLATAQDIAHGVGKVTQQRGQTTHELDKVDIPLGLATDAEVSGIDNTEYPRVRVGSKEYQANSTGHQAAWDVKPLIYGAGVELTADNPFVYYDSVIYQALSVPVTLSGDPAGDDLSPVNPATWSIFLSGAGSSGGVLTWLYNDGLAVGGETEIIIPFSFSYIASVYINGVYQAESLAYEVTSNSVVLAEALDVDDEVVIQVGTTPAQVVNLDPTLRADLPDLRLQDLTLTYNFENVTVMKASLLEFPLTKKLSTGSTVWEVTSVNETGSMPLDSGLYVVPVTDVWVDDFIVDRTADASVAFEAAISLDRKIQLTEGSYFVTNLSMPSGLQIEGPRDALLRCSTAGESVFLADTAGDKLNVYLKGFSARAATAYQGCSFVRQTNKANYLAYATFENIETWKDFEVTYDGFFIFTRWLGGRDGYYGSSVVGQNHKAIQSIPAAFGQSKQTNLNLIQSVYFFNSDDTEACIDIAYGNSWTVKNCDFEQLDTRAIRARGIYGLYINDGTWFEEVRATELILATISPSPGAQGSRPVVVDKCFVQMADENSRFITIGSASAASIVNTTFSQVDAGQTVSNKLDHPDIYNNNILSGDSSTFLTGTYSSKSGTAMDRLEMLSGTINAPVTSNINMLPIGPSGLGASNLANVGYVSKTDVASSIGLAAAVRVTNAGAGCILYYALPSKLVAYLRGKTITVSFLAYGDTGAGTNSINAAIWENVTPDYNNRIVTGNGIVSSEDTLGSGYATHTISESATSIAVGIRGGGIAPSGTVTVESMTMVLGTVKPIGVAL